MEGTENPEALSNAAEGAAKPRSRTPSPKRSASRSPPRSASRSPKRSGSRSPKKNGSRSPARRSASPTRGSSRSPARKRSRSPARRSRSPRRRSTSRSRSRSRGRRSSRSRSRGRKSPTNVPPNDVLGVFGLNPSTTRRDLEDEFSRFPEYDRVDLIIDRQTMRSKCFGFVYFKTVEGAMKAKEEMSGITLHGKEIRVDFSTTKKAHSPTPGRYLGKSSRRNNDRGYHPYSRYPSSSSYDYYSRRSPPRRDSYYDDRDRYDRDRYGGDRYSSSSYDRYDRSSYDRAPSSYDYGRRPYR